MTLAFQLIWAGYAANVAFDAAAEGATIAATADGTDRAGIDRAERVLHSLSAVSGSRITASHSSIDGWPATAVTVQINSPLIGFGLLPVVQTSETLDETIR